MGKLSIKQREAVGWAKRKLLVPLPNGKTIAQVIHFQRVIWLDRNRIHAPHQGHRERARRRARMGL